MDRFSLISVSRNLPCPPKSTKPPPETAEVETKATRFDLAVRARGVNVKRGEKPVPKVNEEPIVSSWGRVIHAWSAPQPGTTPHYLRYGVQGRLQARPAVAESVCSDLISTAAAAQDICPDLRVPSLHRAYTSAIEARVWLENAIEEGLLESSDSAPGLRAAIDSLILRLKDEIG